MQPPPFESPGGPVKKKGSPLPWIIVGGVLVCCVGPIVAGGGAAYFGMKGVSPMIGCTFEMQGISRALESYTKEHGGKLPPAATWQKDIAPYYDKMLSKEETGPFSIPKSTEPFGCGDGASKTPFVFNTQYAGKKLSEIKDPDKAILVFETSGTPEMNKSGVYKDPGAASAPKIFNQPRGWFALNANLEPVTIEDGQQTPTGRGRRR